MTCQSAIEFVLSMQHNMQAEGPTLRWDTIFVGTPRKAAVMWVQPRHMTGSVTAWSRTLALLLLSPGRVCEDKGQRKLDGGGVESTGNRRPSVGAVFGHERTEHGPYMAHGFGQ